MNKAATPISVPIIMRFHPSPRTRHRLIASLAALGCLRAATAATWQWDGGASTGNWQSSANWSPDAPNPNFNGTFADRLNVNGTQPLIYTAAEGTTNYGTTGGARGLVIGSGALGRGSMGIAGGTFSSLNADAADVIGNATTAGVTSSLIVSGGTFIGSVAGTLNNFGGTGQTGIVTVSAGAATFTTLTVSNAVGGTGTVNLDGGTLSANLLNKISTGTAIVNLNGGTLQARQNNTAFMTGLNQANVKAGGAVIDTNGFDVTVGQALLDGTGGGGLTKNNAGKLTLTGANTYTGTTTINAGTLELGNGGATGSPGAGSIVNNGVLSLNRTGSFTVGNAISGNGSVTKSAAGFVTLGGANTYSGTTDILGGAVVATVDGALGTAAGGTTVAANAALALSGGVSYGTAEPLTISGPGITAASAPFAAVQRGAIQAVTGANSWKGDIVVTSAANTRIGVQDGASLTLHGKITEQTPGSSIAFRHGNTAGSDIVLNGTGSSWTGFTDVYGGGGGVVLGVSNALSPSAVLRLGTSGIPGSSTLDLHGFNQTVAGLTQVVLNMPATVTNQAAATTSRLTVDASADSLYPAAISDGAGVVALTKKGSGTLTLSGGTSTYSGGTVIDGGRLLANNTTGSATGLGDVTVNPGGTFGGTGAVSGGVVTTVGSFLSPGASIESLSVGSATGSGTLVIEYDGAAGTPVDFLSVLGTLNVSGMSLEAQPIGSPLVAPSYVFASYGTLTGTFAAATLPAGYAVDYHFGGLNQIAFVQVPEPTAAGLAALGVGAVLRRRRKAPAPPR